MRSLICIILGLFFIASVNAAQFTLSSTAFSNQDRIPTLYSCNGKNISPPLSWSNVPAKTQSFALIFYSPDWSAGKVYFWVVYNLPADLKALPERGNKKLPAGALVGNNYYNETEYDGPCPPDGFTHHYIFAVFALDSMLDLNQGADIDTVLEAIESHELGQAQLTGIFSH